MIQFFLFLVVSGLLGATGVFVATRAGLFPTPEERPVISTTWRGGVVTPPPPSSARAIGMVALVIIGVWILFWIVVLIVGIAYIDSATS